MSGSFGGSNSTGASLGGNLFGGGSENLYDPNRAFLQSQIEQEMYGNGEPTGAQFTGSSYGSYANPYQADPNSPLTNNDYFTTAIGHGPDWVGPGSSWAVTGTDPQQGSQWGNNYFGGGPPGYPDTPGEGGGWGTQGPNGNPGSHGPATGGGGGNTGGGPGSGGGGGGGGGANPVTLGRGGTLVGASQAQLQSSDPATQAALQNAAMSQHATGASQQASSPGGGAVSQGWLNAYGATFAKMGIDPNNPMSYSADNLKRAAAIQQGGLTPFQGEITPGGGTHQYGSYDANGNPYIISPGTSQTSPIYDNSATSTTQGKQTTVSSPQGRQTTVTPPAQTSTSQGRSVNVGGPPQGTSAQRDGSVTDQNGNVVGHMVNGQYVAGGGSSPQNATSPPPANGASTIPDRSRGAAPGATQTVTGPVYNASTNDPGNARMTVNNTAATDAPHHTQTVNMYDPNAQAPNGGHGPAAGYNPPLLGSGPGFSPVSGGYPGTNPYPGNWSSESTVAPSSPVGNIGGGGLSGQRDTTGNLTFGGLSQMLLNPGYSQRTQGAINQQAMQAAQAQYAGANEAMNRGAAATGSNAGLMAGLASNARNQAGTLSDTAAQNQIAFANEAQRQKESALSGLSNLYGQQSGNYNTLLGIASGLAANPVGTMQANKNNATTNSSVDATNFNLSGSL